MQFFRIQLKRDDKQTNKPKKPFITTCTNSKNSIVATVGLSDMTSESKLMKKISII